MTKRAAGVSRSSLSTASMWLFRYIALDFASGHSLSASSSVCAIFRPVSTSAASTFESISLDVFAPSSSAASNGPGSR